ncbi:MAG: hypothetical protein LBI42_10485 [Chitinispirillales bacterium]|jgi:hypothetical protein|nr:hypothetical protein [Chitinispirillales bacterium]
MIGCYTEPKFGENQTQAKILEITRLKPAISAKNHSERDRHDYTRRRKKLRELKTVGKVERYRRGKRRLLGYKVKSGSTL